MKYFVKLFVVTSFLLLYTHSYAQAKVAYLDMTYILNNSKAGKGAQDFLKNSLKKSQEKFTNNEAKLKKEEGDILSKKNDLKKEEFQQKLDALRKKVIDYQSERKLILEKITKQRADARQKLIKTIDPILKDYIQQNEITLLIDKKNVIMGNADLDITNIIIEKLNKELPSLNLN